MLQLLSLQLRHSHGSILLLVFLQLFSLQNNVIPCEDDPLRQERIHDLNSGRKLEVELKYLENDPLHLYKLIKSEWTLHELADVIDDRVFDLQILGTHKQGHRGYERTNLLRYDPKAALVLLSEPINAVVDL